MTTNHHINKLSHLLTVCSLVSLLSLLALSTTIAAAETSRTAEAILSGKTDKITSPLLPQKQETEKTARTAEQLLNSSKSKQKNTLLPPTPNLGVIQQSKSHVVKKKKTYLTNSSHMLNGVKIEIQSCKYVPEYKSITCDMALTNQESDIEAVIHCYTGTMATDENGNNLQCAHIWLGSNHSWKFAHGKLPQGKPVKGMIRLETKRPISQIRELEISVNFKGVRQSITKQNITINQDA